MLPSKEAIKPKEQSRSINPHSIIYSFKHQVESSPQTIPDEEITSQLRQVAKRFIKEPDTLEFFYQYSHAYKEQNPQQRQMIVQLEQGIDNEINRLAEECDPNSFTERQLIGFLQLSEKHSLLPEYVVGEFDSSQVDLSKIADTVLTCAFKGCLDRFFKEHNEVEISNRWNKNSQLKQEVENKMLQSQKNITELVYKLSTAALALDDKDILKKLFKIFSFETKFLPKDSPLSFMFITSMASLDDDVFAKRMRLDILGALLNNMITDDEKELAEKGNSVFGKYEKSIYSEIYLNLLNRDRKRSELLIGFNGEDRPFAQEKKVDDLIDYLAQPYPWPESLINKANRFMFLFFNLLSRRYLEIGKVSEPIELLVVDNQELKYISVQEVPDQQDLTSEPSLSHFELAQLVLNKILSRKVRGVIDEPMFMTTILRFLRPELDIQRKERLKQNSDNLKNRLKNPSRGLSKDGVIVKIDQEKNPDLYCDSIQFDFSGRKIQFDFGGNIVELLLDYEDLHLKYRDGKPLKLDEESKLWWENVVLAPLERLVCNDKNENGWILSGDEDLSPDDAKERRNKAIIRRIGHLRHEPPGKGYTDEQRNKTLSIRYPLPGIEILDLDKHNKDLGITKNEGQYTYVLPVVKEATGQPLEIITPDAFNF